MKISVITPVYDGSPLIHRVWESLISQTIQNFEWIIVDDGSSDNLSTVVDDFIEQKLIPISFIKNDQNQGKHIAVNKGIAIAKGEFTIIADCDDRFKNDSFEVFLNTWESVPTDTRSSFCGVRVACEDQFGNRISDVFKHRQMDLTMKEAFYIHRYRNETWCMVLTKLHKLHPFPVNFKGSHYPEDIIWKKISEKKKLRFINNSLRIYYVNQGNSIMSITDPSKNYSVRIERSLDIINNDMMYFRNAPSFFFKTSLILISYSIFNLSLLRNLRKIENGLIRFILFCLIPFGVLGSMLLLSKKLKAG